jgi:putative restriction endonuclease
MKLYVGVTDNSWFEYLSGLKPDEVNFWKPTGQPFKAIGPGCLFLFKLHSPFNFIAGGGYFVRYEVIPLTLAWDAFGEKNGANSLSELREIILKYRRSNESNPQIGCIILNEPFFFPRNQWIRPPEDWSANIVTGKGYQMEESIGRNLWESVKERLVFMKMSDRIEEPKPEYQPEELLSREYLMRARLGQGAFRVLVTSAYNRRCAISGEKTLPVLEAAHIKPFGDKGPNRVDNGILLRSDMHKLFDAGYLTITPSYCIEVSRRIKEEFENGGNYYSYHGKVLSVLPKLYFERPNKNYLGWHNENIYKG